MLRLPQVAVSGAFPVGCIRVMCPDDASGINAFCDSYRRIRSVKLGHDQLFARSAESEQHRSDAYADTCQSYEITSLCEIDFGFSKCHC